jgi:alpha-tubulin suppressor-like RCC1 family protein
MRAVSVVLPSAIALALGVSCRDPTEITIDLTTDAPCPSLNTTRIAVGAPAELDNLADSTTTDACNGGSIGSIVLVPSGDKSAQVGVRVVTGVSRRASDCVAGSIDGCIVARRVLRYLPHTPLHMTIAMRSACIGVSCPSDQTCVEGKCTSAVVDPGQCVGAGCDETGLGDGGAPEGAASDAPSVDGSIVLPTVNAPLSVYGFGCALAANGNARCWGANDQGQMGNGDTGAAQLTPGDVALGIKPAALAVGERHACALGDGGGAYCWGQGAAGELGDGTASSSPRPVRVRLTGTAVKLSAGFQHTCALMSNGTVQCWGINTYRELGDPTNDVVPSPFQVPGISGATDVAVGGGHVCAIVGAKAVCWGADGYGQLGDGTTVVTSSPPLNVALPEPPIALAAGVDHTCALGASRAVYCWGANETGQLGNGTVAVTSSDPTPLPHRVAVGPAVAIAAAAAESCAILVDGSLACWGSNDDGELGIGKSSAVPASSPVTVKNVSNPTQIAVGHSLACARLTSGQVECWGYNANGELGRGTKTAEEPLPAPAQNLP